MADLSYKNTPARVGYERLRNRGHFQQPDSARDAIEEMEALSSPVTAFISERCHITPGLSAPVSTLYSAWREWCQDNGRREPGTVQTFGRDVKAAYPGIKTKQPRDDGKRLRVYEGIGLI